MSKNKFNEVYSSIRKGWGSVKPTTQTHKDKTKYSRKKKHKENFNENS